MGQISIRSNVGLKDSSGKIVTSWRTSWDSRYVMPLKVKALPHWKASGGVLPFGKPLYYETRVNVAEFAGSYSFVMRIQHALERIIEAGVRGKNHMPAYLPWNKPVPFVFANKGQGSDGWLGLGKLAIK